MTFLKSVQRRSNASASRFFAGLNPVAGRRGHDDGVLTENGGLVTAASTLYMGL